TRSAFIRDKGPAAITGTIKRGLRNVDHIGIMRIEKNLAEVTAALDARIAGDLLPTRSAIIGTVESSLPPPCHDRINAFAARRHRDTDAPHPLGRKPGSAPRFPCLAAIGSLQNRGPAVAVDLCATVCAWGGVMRPQRGKADFRIRRIKGQVDRASGVVL